MSSLFSFSQIPTNGLIGYWPFSGNANDSTGNTTNVEINSPTLTSDRFGNTDNAYQFDGINDNIIIRPLNTSFGNLNNYNEFSISLWLNKSSNNFSNTDIFDLRDTLNNNQIALLIQNDSIQFVDYEYPGGLGSWSLKSVFSDYNTWVNIIVTIDKVNTLTRLYLNGSLLQQSNNSLASWPSSNRLTIGSRFDFFPNTCCFFDGKIDDVAIYNRVLTQSAIDSIISPINTSISCTSANLPVSLANGIMAWYPFCGNANDESGNGNIGIANGPLLTQDRFGNANSAYQFNGTSDYILTSLMPPTGKSSRTIAFWAKTNDPNIMVPMDYGDANGNGGSFDLIFNSPCEGFGLDVGDGVVTRGDTSLINNNWHHCVVLYDSTYGNTISNARIFIDGIEQPSVSCSAVDPNAEIQTIPLNPLNIGRAFTNVRYFHGDLDDIGVWNRTLTNQEILNLYQTGICFQNVTVTDTLIINANITGFNPVTYQNSIKIYPNPAYDHITIDNGSNYSTLAGYTLRIDNSLAQTVYSTVVNQQMYSIDLSSWSGNGVYFVYLINSTGHIVDVKKIVIQ